MLDLGKIRDEIDATDDEIVRLFQHRMALTAEVAQYKIETGKAVFDAERERQKLEKLTGEGTNAFNTKGIQELFQQIMSISRKRCATFWKPCTPLPSACRWYLPCTRERAPISSALRWAG